MNTATDRQNRPTTTRRAAACARTIGRGRPRVSRTSRSAQPAATAEVEAASSFPYDAVMGPLLVLLALWFFWDDGVAIREVLRSFLLSVEALPEAFAATLNPLSGIHRTLGG